MTGNLTLGVAGGSSTVSGVSKLTETERADLKERGQAVISQAQVQDLSKVLDLVEGVFKSQG